MKTWNKFDDIVKPEEINKSVAYEQSVPIEAGVYDAVLEEIIPTESRKGLPMLKGRFRLADGRTLFYNQMLKNNNHPKMTAINITEAVKLVSGLLGEDVVFESMGAFGAMIQNIPVDTGYSIKINYGKKDVDKAFPKITVLRSGVTVVPEKRVEQPRKGGIETLNLSGKGTPMLPRTYNPFKNI